MNAPDGTVFLTICACNYLGFAGALGRSIAEHHPGSKFVVWLIDDMDSTGLRPGFSVRNVREILTEDEFAHFALQYNVRELSTAVKPHCLKAELNAGAERVIYIDPDILVFRPLKQLMQRFANGASAVLTPHILRPLPRDHCIPDDLIILASGIYNLGFIALSNTLQTEEFLDWWAAWLRDICFEDHASGAFTDQKWVNFAPVFWPEFELLCDPDYNVAYWNLPQRELTRTGGEWCVDGVPLTFFHFSGFNPDRPNHLSKHQDRIEVRKGSALAEILALYADRLRQAGHAHWRLQPYSAPCFGNGILVDDICRSLYRDARAAGVRFSDPLLGTGRGSLYSWITSVLPSGLSRSGPSISRYKLKVWNQRPDVQQRFPRIPGRDSAGFLVWLRKSGIKEMKLIPELVGETHAEAPPEPIPGVNYVGYLRSELGLGEAARGNVVALEAQDLAVALVDVSHLASSSRSEWRKERDMEGLAEDNRYDINVLHVNADQLFRVRDHIGSSFFTGRYNIGVWAWETPDFPPQWRDRFSVLDEIWVGGSFMAESIARVSPIPVIHIPHVVDVPGLVADKARFGLDRDEFLILFMFDFHSTPTRKNPEAAIEAFRRAFSPDEPVRLVMKSMNGHNRPDDLARLRRLATGLKVSFIDEALDSESRYLLLASCDTFLSLHRAEGFGLGIAEAMAYGKPVVATGWSGNMDFMHVGNSRPVGFELRELATDDPPYLAGTLWAEPDIDHAASLLREMWEQPSLAAEVGQRARRDVAARLNAGAVGAQMRDRIDVIRKNRQCGAADRSTDKAVTGAHDMDVYRPRELIRKIWRAVWWLTPIRFKPAVRRWAIRVKQRMGYL